MATVSRNLSSYRMHTGPTMNFTGTVSITRNSPQDSVVNVVVSGSISMPYGGTYGTPYSGQGLSVSFNTTSNDSLHGNHYNISSGYNFYESFSTIWTGGNGTIYINCRFGSKNSSSWYCDQGSNDTVIATFGINELPYNPYTAPSISYSSITPIAKIDIGTWTATYSVVAPAGAKITDLGLDIMRNGATLKNYSFGTASGNRTSNFTIATSGTTITDGMSFDTRMYVNDSSGNSIHNSSNTNKVTRTYKKPIMRNITDFKDVPFSPQDKKILQWETNSRMWSANNLETEFVTEISKGKDRDKVLDGIDVSQKPVNTADGVSNVAISSLTITKDVLNNLFTTQERSVSVMDGVLRVDRTSNSGGYRAYATTTIKVQYQPTKSPLNGIISDSSSNSVAGKTIFIQDVPKLNIDWTYPISSGAAGVVDGYILRIYSDNQYQQQYGKDIIWSVTQNATNTTYKLDTKTELKRGVMNYIKITPYYQKPDGSGRIEGTKSLQMTLVLPISRINTPEIEYPINKSNWHNKNFRVLLQLPSDDDIESLNLSDEDYRYQDIELKITPNNITANAITYSFKNNPEIFSTSVLSHKKKIAINPSVISSLPDVPTYRLELRVQKNYYVTTGEDSYSKWSSAVTIQNTPVNNLNLSVGQEIELSHYDYVRNAIIRLHDTYPIYDINENNVGQAVGDQIDYKEYDGISKDIQNIQIGVNNYCDYDSDKQNIKFQNEINILSGKQEYITAKLNDLEITGRNYMNTLIEEMKKLM